MEKSNIKIYGKSIFKIITIINKLGLKDFLGKIINEYSEIEKKNRVAKVKIIKELDKRKLKNTPENLAVVLDNNKSLAKEYAENNKKSAEILQDLIFTILERLPQAENDIYVLLAEIYNKDPKTIAEETEIDEIVEMIENIIRAEGFSKVFTRIFK